MEKFAVDLDKVLDDFEFNEDCAEQIASVSSSACNIPTTKSLSNESQNYSATDIGSVSKRFEIMPSFERHKDFQQINSEDHTLSNRTVTADNVHYYKGSLTLENTDSTNNFCTDDDIDNTSKITLKQCIHNTGQISLSVYNDTSHKVLQKQPNENNTIKIHNTYDKKLNQPNIKPSVSNVFNSLNEYINAPTGSLGYIEAALDKEDVTSEKQSDVLKDETDTFIKSTSVTDNKFIGSIPMNNNETVIHEKCKSDSSCIMQQTTLPEYQNISLPTKVVSSVENDSIAENISIKNTFSSDSVVLQSQKQFDDVALGIASTTDNTEYVFNMNMTASKMLNFSSTNENVNIKNSNIENNADRCVQENSDIDVDRNNLQSVQNNYISENAESLLQATTEISVPENNINNDVCAITSSIQDKEEASSLDVVKQIPNSILISNSSTAATQLINTHLTKQLQKPIGFNNIEALSEKELNIYLAEFEVEENLKKGISLHKEISPITLQNDIESNDMKDIPLKCDVKISEATSQPLSFESITINDLSRISETGLKETVKASDYHKKSEILDNDLQNHNLGKLYDSVERISTRNEDENKECGKELEISQNNEDNKDSADSFPVDTMQDDKAKNIQSHTPFSETNVSEIKESLEDMKAVIPRRHINENVITLQSNQIDELSTSNVVEQNSTLFEDKTLYNSQNFSIDAAYKTTDSAVELNNKEITEELDKPIRPQTLDIVSTVNTDSVNTTPIGPELSDVEDPIDCQRLSPGMLDNPLLESGTILGKQPPFWVPDSDAPSCMLCEVKFTVLKRRHHCRACGKVLCNKCCSMKHKLEYQGNIDSRVCVPCHQLLTKANNEEETNDWSSSYNANSSNMSTPQGRQPNPNNPMEYCSTIPPLQQLAGGLPPPPPTVMVPVGVLKREGATRQRSEGSKSVMFSDGIRPGCDLTELDTSWDLKPPYRKAGNKKVTTTGLPIISAASKKQNLPPLDPNTNSYIPRDSKTLPPTVTIHKGQVTFHNVADDETVLYKTLKNECEAPVMFAINRNLYAYVKIINLNCCVNKICWNISSKGLACVGQDEVIFLVETLPDEIQIPRDLLIFINQLYIEAIKGNTVTELSFSVYQGGNLLGSREHAGFLFIRQTLQCLQKIVLPPAPFLLGLLVHRWETPWAKVFPLRLVLRLGAEYRYYPCPLVSVRFRDALYFEIGHTVMKVLADFRNFGYTLPGVRGLTIHLRNRMTDVMFPRNRYDQVIKGLNSSNDHVLAYASNFSIVADSHLVCIQTNTGDESSYQTQAINIHNKPRTVTGASFIVINGALKSSMGLSAKSSIVEDGLMVEIMPEKMEALKAALKNMQDFSIGCGRQGALEPDETVNIKWVPNDVQFNLGVKSPIDGQLMDGIPSIRVHNGTDYRGTSRFIRWTEVFIIKSDDHPNGVHDPVDINKLSGNIAKATCTALVKLLDLLATAGLTKLGVRTTIHPDNVGYEAGSEGMELPPIYMKSLDNELIHVLHKAAHSSQDTYTVLELIFYILDD